jgi:hypothetical protein
VKNRLPDTTTTLFTFIDTLNNPYDLTDFKRVIKDVKGNENTYFLKDGRVLLYSKDLNVGYIKPVPKQKFYKPKILTFDIETRDIEVPKDTGDIEIMKIPLSMCFYDGKNSFYYLFTDPNN